MGLKVRNAGRGEEWCVVCRTQANVLPASAGALPGAGWLVVLPWEVFAGMSHSPAFFSLALWGPIPPTAPGSEPVPPKAGMV